MKTAPNTTAHSIIKKALYEIDDAWFDMKHTPVNMTVEEFEKRILRQAKANGTPYSTEPGRWLDIAKKAITNSNVPQETKNLYLAEVHPKELRPAYRRFQKALSTLIGAAELAYPDLKVFLEDKSVDEKLRAFLRWRVFLAAEAYHKFYRLRLKGRKSRAAYLTLKPSVIFRTK